MEAHRLRAPTQDGGLLAVPPLSEAEAVLNANRAVLGAWQHDFQGGDVARLRSMARAELLAQSRLYHERSGLDVPETDRSDAIPWIVTGHQPELFHPGVWAKNFAVGRLASQIPAIGLNLIVDNDVPHSPSIRVPTRSARGLRTLRVEFDEWSSDRPYEDWVVRDERLFSSFADRVRKTLDHQVADPVLDRFWPYVEEAASRTDRPGYRFAIARRRLEAEWGVHNFEVPLSRVCQTEAFCWFASHILAHLPRFQEIHNRELTAYRRRLGIRSAHHPVPALTSQGEWREAPFWVWRDGSPRRQPLLVRQKPRTMDLRFQGEDEPFLEDLPLAPDREACCAIEQVRGLSADGIRFRTRALTTTMFNRLLLGDLFVHGIGGAKYDELGDEIIRGFFGTEPPDYMVLSLTVWLGLQADVASPAQLRDAERLIRDLTYNPDRHLAAPLTPDLQLALEAKRRAVAGPLTSRRERVDRFLEIRRQNDILRSPLRQELDRLGKDRDRLRISVAQGMLAHDRDFSFVLHSQSHLRATLARAFPRDMAR